MFWCKKTHGGSCESILKRLMKTQTVKIELSDGLTFIDEVLSVRGEGESQVVVMKSREVALSSISQLEVA